MVDLLGEAYHGFVIIWELILIQTFEMYRLGPSQRMKGSKTYITLGLRRMEILPSNWPATNLFVHTIHATCIQTSDWRNETSRCHYPNNIETCL